MQKSLFTLYILIGIGFSAACSPNQISLIPEPNMPNPASVYCEKNGGKLELRQDALGGVAGMCIFPDGSECDEWAYFRNECKPGDSLVKTVPAASPVVIESTPTITSEVASDGWKIYRNEEFDYSFHYPAYTAIMMNEDPQKSLTISGLLVENENWPQITISHPRDREDYRPPEGVDLLQWLTDHFLLGDERMPDVQIAETAAIHFRHERSPQSYAFDRYYFAKSGQLYMIVIGHVGDKEDWEVYNHFLESIQFGS
jgi:putative hemolysin